MTAKMKIPENISAIIKEHKAELLGWDPDILIQAKSKHTHELIMNDMKALGWSFDADESETGDGFLHFTRGNSASSNVLSENNSDSIKKGCIFFAYLAAGIGIVAYAVSVFDDRGASVSYIALWTIGAYVFLCFILGLAYYELFIDGATIRYRSFRTLFCLRTIPFEDAGSFSKRKETYDDGDMNYLEIWSKKDERLAKIYVGNPKRASRTLKCLGLMSKRP